MTSKPPPWRLRLPRTYLAGVIVAATMQAVSLLGFLMLMRRAIDLMNSPTFLAPSILPLAAWLVVATSINTAGRYWEFRLSENMGYELVRRLRMEMYAHLQRMTPRQLQGRARGGLLLRFTGDLSMMRTWVSRGIGRGLSSSFVLLGGLVAIWIASPRQSIMIVGVLLIGSGATIRLGPRLQRVTRWVRRKRSLVVSNIDEQVHSMAVVQVFGRSSGEYQRLSRQNDSLTASLFQTSSIRGQILGVGSATAWMAIVGVLVIGAFEVTSGRATVGTVATALLAARHLAGPMRRLVLSYDYRQRARVSEQKIREFLSSSSRPVQQPSTPRLRIGAGSVQIENLHVKGALHGISAVIPGGKMVALMGPIGAGKSTLLAVIAGLEDPDAGSVAIDGQSDCTPDSRFQKVGMVSPDLPLMRGSIARNIMYRSRREDAREVDRVVRMCQIEELVDRRSNGAETRLYEGGRNLSVGERQRLCLARAMVGNPPILLLDEPTSGLDASSRSVIHDIILRYRGTVIMVTHDQDEASLADEIWEIREGRLVGIISGDAFRDMRWMASQGKALTR
jgi:ATP-binding cassette, subfamily B, bacterial